MKPECTSGFGPVGTNGKRDGGEVERCVTHHDACACRQANVERALAESREEVRALVIDNEAYQRNLTSEAEARIAAEARAERLAGALQQIRDFDGDPRVPVYNISRMKGIARSTLAALEQEPQE